MNFRISIFFFLFTALAFGQTKGKITFSMNFSSDNPDMAMVSSMMQGSTMTLSFMPKKNKIEVKMGMMGTMTTIGDVKKKKTLLLMDMMGQKSAAEDKIDPSKADSASMNTKIELVNETKTILGYTCKKAIISTEDGAQMTFWYTEDIKADLAGQRQFNSKIPGVVLEFSTKTGEMTIDFVATEFTENVSKTDFDMSIPEGYTIKTPEEMQMMGQ